MNSSPAFIDLAAVEAWDAWFRWRHHNDLRDRSIQDTWARVARALARSAWPEPVGQFEQRLVDAQGTWRLLFDERLLRTAGTDAPAWPDRDLVASINLAALVTDPGTEDASFDLPGLEATAELAVLALDNAALLATQRPAPAGASLRIGMIGLADALLLLGLRYESANGRKAAHRAARHLAMGCLRGSLRLAHERGAQWDLTQLPAQAYKLREISPEMATEAARVGLRHTRLTAITSQRQLALLANNVADAVDPLSSTGRLKTMADGARAHAADSLGYAMEVLRRQGVVPRQLAALTLGAAATVDAQMDLRAAMQMWIDEPILYPFDTSNGVATSASPDNIPAPCP
nr:hypothetical protein [Dyella sp. ASV21]